MFILQVPTVAPGGPPPQNNDENLGIQDLINEVKNTNPPPRSTQTSGGSPAPGGNGQDTFNSSNPAINELTELLRSGVSPDSRTIRNFLREKNLENNPEARRILENRQRDRARIRQLLIDGATLQSPPVQSIAENSTLSERELTETIQEAEEEKTEGSVSWGYVGNLAYRLIPGYGQYLGFRDIYNDYEYASRLPENSRERNMAYAEAHTNVGMTAAFLLPGTLMGRPTLGNEIHVATKPIRNWIRSWFE